MVTWAKQSSFCGPRRHLATGAPSDQKMVTEPSGEPCKPTGGSVAFGAARAATMAAVIRLFEKVHDACGFQNLAPFDIWAPDTLMTTYTYSLPLVSIAVYVGVIILLPKCFRKDHPGYRKELKYFAALWNLALSLGSVAMLIGMATPYLQHMESTGFVDTVWDEEAFFVQPSRMWIWNYAFVLSKFAEMGDTIFLILKAPGRDVISGKFLHWYHHVTVLAFTWFAAYNHYSAGYLFLIFNAFVHSLMYFYYSITELGIRPGNLVAMPLTILQIVQMLFGIFINGLYAYLWLTAPEGATCTTTNPGPLLVAAAGMYASYFYLFCQFFVGRYLAKPQPRTGKKKAH